MSEQEDPFADTRMPLGEHLKELRSRLFKGVATVFVAFLVAWVFRDTIALIVTGPYHRSMDMLEEHWVGEAERLLAEDPERPRTDFFTSLEPENKQLRGLERRLQSITPGEPFFFQLKICLYFAVFAGSPVLLWQLWQFVAAGLYRKERKSVTHYFPVSVLLFLVGILFGYFIMVPYAMYFLNRSVSLELSIPNITIQAFLTFISSLCLAFGAIFQLPLILTFLSSAGIVEPSTMSRYRGHFIVGAFVLAAILTPPDPFTQLLMGLPLLVLYEIGVLCARVADRRSRAKQGLTGEAGA
jgi:sec-independent protein translocase protein TatC